METEGRPRSGEDEGARGERAEGGPILGIVTGALECAACAVVDPATVPIQPYPIDWDVIRFYRAGQISTVAREWAPGDAARCRLCARCKVRPNNRCLVTVGRDVSAEEAPLLSTVGLRDQRARGLPAVALGELHHPVDGLAVAGQKHA
jgi:hypothetical protein